MNADSRVMAYFLKTLDHAESDALAARIREHFQRHGFGFWAVEAIGAAGFIGFVGLAIPRFPAPFMPCIEIGWRLAHAHWGKGYAGEAAVRALDFGFREQWLREIVSFTVAGNLRSRQVMERLGMRRDPADDFDHPNVPEGHPHRRHVLYRLAPGAA